MLAAAETCANDRSRGDPNARALPPRGYEVSVVVVVVTWGEEEGALGAIVNSPAYDFARSLMSCARVSVQPEPAGSRLFSSMRRLLS
jgi:hypothetical protein